MLGSKFRSADRLTHALRPVIENLEARCLLSVDPLANQALIQTLPFTLDFSSQVNGLHDKDGEDIGLTRVQINKNGLNSSYLPANLDLRTDLGLLNITTSGTAAAGSNFNGDNTLTNSVETQFDATTSGFSITARLKGPLGYLSSPSDQGGIYFGPDQDNYIKLVAVSQPSGQVLQFTDEQKNGATFVHSVDLQISVGAFANINTLDLKLVGDAGSGKVQAFYAINGAAYTKFATDIFLTGVTRTAFFTAAGRAGLIAVNKNDLPPITVSFDSFQILPGSTLSGRPTVTAIRPANGETAVRVDSFVAADLNLPNSGVDSATVTTDTVKLYRTSDHLLIPGTPGTSGGGDAIIFQPTVLLDPNTNYTFEITDQLKDVSGAAFVPFASNFTTGTTGGETDPSLSFEKVALNNATGAGFTSLKIGPDHKLYGTTDDGRILRWVINGDGTLATPQTIATIQTANSGPRLITGLTFDPASTANNLIAWVTHGVYVFTDAPDWSGKLTRLSGPNLATWQDYLINLPRSARDHLTNQPSFGPDGKLYFAQGSNSSMGDPDPIWSSRDEHLMTAAIIQVDTATLASRPLPLNMKTVDGGGTYDPFAANQPVKVYASGVRNAFDLVWTQDGTLYVPANGSAAGGNTPAYPNAVTGRRPDGSIYSGPNVPSLTNAQLTEDDWLFKVTQGGYYGHPNPSRAEYVLNGGNPTNNVDSFEFAAYPTGVLPDANYRGAAYDFGKNRSPDGIIEYIGGAFGGTLNGKLLVAEYSGGDDIAVLTRGANGNITSVQRGIAGLRGFVDPLDLIEDTAPGSTNGYIYVSEYGAQKLTLLRPIAPGANLTPSKTQFVFNDIQTASTGGTGASPTQVLTITNTGTTALTFPVGGISIVDDPAVAGADNTAFKIVNSASLPDTVKVGESIQIQLNFTASAVRIFSAFLQLTSNDSTHPTMKIALRGIGTTGTGGTNEPSFARILRAYQIPTIVGDGPNDNGEATTAYPTPPDASSEEVSLQQLVKAGVGAVTIEPLAVEAIGTNPPIRFGWYGAGTRDSKQELFAVAQGDAQSVNPTPLGLTSFDPGASVFGLYTLFPGFTDPVKDNNLPREVYSEDALNSWSSSQGGHDVRFFPLRNTDGTIVPNAFIFAFEEFDSVPDSNDVIGIIRNVQAAPAGPRLGLENQDSVPFPDRLVFSRIQHPNATIGNTVHDTATLLVRNTGSSPLTISSWTVTGAWQITTALPATPIAARTGTYAVTLKFIASTIPAHTGNETNGTDSSQGATATGVFTINSDDATQPAKKIDLAGYWQNFSENANEPAVRTIVQKIFGYGTTIEGPGQTVTTGGLVSRVGDEVLSPYWNRADGSRAVTVRQLAAFHTQGNTATLFWHKQGTTVLSTLITHSGASGQSIVPFANGTTSPAYNFFNPTTPFGFKVDGEWSDDTKNTQDGHTSGYGHHMRFWVAKDRAGKIIPNTYLMSMDYSGINYDYNDNVYLIQNIKPLSPPSTPAGLTATSGGAGILLKWTANTEANLAGYNIYRAGAAAGPFTKINTSGLISQADFNDAFAPIGSASFYQVSAVDLSGNESAKSAVASATRVADNTPPAAPAGLGATGSGSGISLDWADNSELDLAGYNVLRSSAANGTFTKINGSLLTVSSYQDLTAPTGLTSFYQVVAVDKSGNVSSPATANATRPAVVPDAPTGVTAAAASSTQINLTWNMANNASTYRVERKGPGETVFSEIASGITTTAYSDTGRQPSSAYSYRVRAENATGLSGYSNTASATTQAQPAAGAPATLSAQANSTTQIALNWAAGANAASYRIERKGPGETVFTEIASGITSTSYLDSGRTPNSTYSYQVRSENAGGLSGYSPIASATTLQQSTSSFTSQDINSTPTGSTNSLSGADHDITAGGSDIYGTADGFRFVYQQVTGNFDVKAQITSFTGGNATSKAGLMARADLGAGSMNIYSFTTIADGFHFSRRSATGGTTSYLKKGVVSYPNAWVRLTRVNNVFTGYYSTDGGTTWVQTTQASQVMASTVLLGMATTAHSTTTTATAQYRNLSGFPGTSVVVAPSAPATLNASAVSNSRIDLSWSGSFGATSYRIERMGPGEASFTEIASGVAGTTYSNTGLSDSSTYTYQVRAENSAGPSGYSPQASATTQAAPTLPAAPATLNANADSPTQITLSWSAGSGAASYRVERKGPGEVSFSQIASGVTTTSFVDSGRTPSSTYSYQVRSENAAGLSGYSPIASATTPQQPVSSAFTSVDISSTPAGSTTVVTDGSDYDVTAGGSDIYGTADGFRYVYKQVTGDFDVKVHITSFTGGNSTSKAGIMARTDLSAGSVNVFSFATIADGYHFSRRSVVGGTTSYLKKDVVAYPNVWVRLKRAGNVFTGFYSTDGVTWVQTTQASQVMPSTLLLGMATTAHSTTTTATAQFRQFG